MSEIKISDKQKKIVSFIREQINKNGYPPSIREIGKAVGLSSSSTVHAHLNTLEKFGLLERDPVKTRAIRVFSNEDDSPGISNRLYSVSSVNDRVKMVPLIGRVAAGEPILAEEHIDEYFAFPVDFLGDDDVFMLEVKGDSMIEAGIHSGDYVMVRQQSDANNGDIVVALLDNEATVKRFFRETNYVKLKPENSEMSPILSRDVTILGKVIGLYRRF